MKKVLFVIAPKEFRDDELNIPKEKLEREGIKTEVASLTKERIKGILGQYVTPDITIEEANPKNYEYVIIIGGPGAPRLASYSALIKLLRSAKNVGALCLGTVVLATAGLLEEKDATTFETPDTLKLLKQAGAHYIEEDVVVDGTTITGSGPDATREFAWKLAKLVKNS